MKGTLKVRRLSERESVSFKHEATPLYWSTYNSTNSYIGNFLKSNNKFKYALPQNKDYRCGEWVTTEDRWIPLACQYTVLCNPQVQGYPFSPLIWVSLRLILSSVPPIPLESVRSNPVKSGRQRNSLTVLLSMLFLTSRLVWKRPLDNSLTISHYYEVV